LLCSRSLVTANTLVIRMASKHQHTRHGGFLVDEMATDLGLRCDAPVDLVAGPFFAAAAKVPRTGFEPAPLA
jgi:hypothetical protein